jgi:hypothetical protein
VIDDLDRLYPDDGRQILFVGHARSYQAWKIELLDLAGASKVIRAGKVVKRSSHVSRISHVHGRHNCIVVRGYGWEEVVWRELGFEDALTIAAAGFPQIYIEDIGGGVTRPTMTTAGPPNSGELPFEPVTDQEMAEVYRSLGVKPEHELEIGR